MATVPSVYRVIIICICESEVKEAVNVEPTSRI